MVWLVEGDNTELLSGEPGQSDQGGRNCRGDRNELQVSGQPQTAGGLQKFGSVGEILRLSIITHHHDI